MLDVTQVMAGPYCAMLLCDMGARVIKIEPPGGDSTRAMAGGQAGDSAAFNAVNRGKLGIVLDLRQAEGRAAFIQLAKTADVVIENYRPGVMAKLGLDYATVSAENQRLVYASISGYGQTGPAAAKGGFDLVAQGVSGIMSVTGEPDRPPVKAGLPVTDLGAGLFALSAILAALYWRSSSGRSGRCENPQIPPCAMISFAMAQAMEFSFATPKISPFLPSNIPMILLLLGELPTHPV